MMKIQEAATAVKLYGIRQKLLHGFSPKDKENPENEVHTELAEVSTEEADEALIEEALEKYADMGEFDKEAEEFDGMSNYD